MKNIKNLFLVVAILCCAIGCPKNDLLSGVGNPQSTVEIAAIRPNVGIGLKESQPVEIEVAVNYTSTQHTAAITLSP